MNKSIKKSFLVLLLAMLIFSISFAGCGTTRKIPRENDDSSDDTGNGETKLIYPFEGKNMFFGLAIINKDDTDIVKDLDISWISLQPHVLWLAIEKTPGEYDWRS
ncbi:MAG: hypothetical protein WC269_03205, partial [Candidatus Gracilibacteria bacterium]